jgi:hypothetical protein
MCDFGISARRAVVFGIRQSEVHHHERKLKKITEV